jgi:glycosyltransferase involved in cell wall biosynthesis
MKLSIVMPTMNEEEAVPRVIRDALRHGSPWNPEILVVDSSSDRTPEIAVEAGARVIRQEPRGHGLALRQAMLEAAGDVIITTDCDDTYPMEFIPRFMRLIEQEGYDAVSGNRIHRKNRTMPRSNKIANWSFAALVRLLHGIPTHDVTTGMHAFKRHVVHAVRWESNYAFPAELIIKTCRNNFKWTEIDIPYRERVGEVTLNRWRSGKAYMRFIIGSRLDWDFDGKVI